ncbi:clathrin light chain isoform X3 [Schistocerca piceifrons]|uniref:clathrin light chain isoform X3 n=1 Tax=Schistocerca piceifrons TaxID=274613 RepID=UPI001F5FB83E|nr:clathrin light chain isoform X3 [Schistocerca piceifrons]
MDGFGDNFDQPEVDPAAEFLAREQDQLAGLEDELNPGNAPPAADDAMFGTQGSAPLTGSFEMIDNFGQQDGLGPDLLSSAPEGVPSEVKAESEPLDAESKETEAENSAAAIAAAYDDGCYGRAGSEDAAAAVLDVDNYAGGGDDSATCDDGETAATDRGAVVECDGSVAAAEGFASVIDSTVDDDSVASDAKVQLDGLTSQPKIFSTPTPPKPVVKEEPEKIRKWREEQKKRLEEKDANEEKRKEELREQAKKELEEWYKHHEEQIAKTKAANRNAEKQFVAEAGEIEPGTEWERIAKLCDFNPKSSKTSKDVSRMRSIILQLKQTPPAAKRA